MNAQEKKELLLYQLDSDRLKNRFEQEYATKDINTVNEELQTIIDIAGSHFKKCIEFPISLDVIKEQRTLDIDHDFYITSQTKTHTDDFSEGYDLFLFSIDQMHSFSDAHGLNQSSSWTSPMLETLKLYRYAVSTPEWLNSSYHCILALEVSVGLRELAQIIVAHNHGYSTWSYITPHEYSDYDSVDDIHKEELHLSDDIVFVPSI